MYAMLKRWKTITSRTIEHDRDAQGTMGNTSSRFLRTPPFRRVFAGSDRQIFAIPGGRNCPIHQSSNSNTKTDQMFARHGIPNVIKTDNGSPFNSDEYVWYL